MSAETDEKIHSSTPHARKSLALALQTLAQVGQAEIARVLGTSESTVSRLKTERLEEVVYLLCACGLKVVPQDYHGDHTEFIDAALVFACYGVKAIRKDQRLLTE